MNEREKADKLAAQIVGKLPLDKHLTYHRHRVIDYDLQAIEKCIKQIKQDFCYLKRATDRFYREPTECAIRTMILNWVRNGKLDNQILPVASGSGKMRKGKPTHRVVNPNKVRLLFLSHRKFDLKINQPGWQGELPNRGTKKVRQRLSLVKRIIRWILSKFD
tara:strand:+ start:3341 stop:3826 length:486 start_codon:yes stop_codon:yes gene_type:complete